MEVEEQVEDEVVAFDLGVEANTYVFSHVLCSEVCANMLFVGCYVALCEIVRDGANDVRLIPLQTIELFQCTECDQIGGVIERLDLTIAEQLRCKHGAISNLLQSTEIVDAILWSNVNACHRRLEEQEITRRPVSLGDVVKVARKADDLACVIQCGIFTAVQGLILDGVLPRQEVDVALDLIQTCFEAYQLAPIMLQEFAKPLIDALKLLSDGDH